MAPHGDPIAELVLTVLSQITNDRNRDVAYLRLRERLTSWEAVMGAPVAEVEEAIRPGGISEGEVGADRGDPAGDPERGGQAPIIGPRAVARLAGRYADRSGPRLPRLVAGRGSQDGGLRAAVCLWHHDVPVDTHVSRVGMRLRLLEPGAPFEQSADQMLALTPPGQELELHVNLLRHGRRTCTQRRPACRDCALARMCPSRGGVAGVE